MNKMPRRLRWSDVYATLDSMEDEEALASAVTLVFPNTPNVTAFISKLGIVGDRIFAHGRFDIETGADYWCATGDESVSEAMLASPLNWSDVLVALEGARRIRNFENVAAIGFPPDFCDERFTNFLQKLYLQEGAGFALAFFDPL